MSAVGLLLGASFGAGAVLFVLNMRLPALTSLIERSAHALDLAPAVLGWIVVGACIGGALMSAFRGASGAVVGCFIGALLAGFTHHNYLASTKRRRRIQQSLLTPAFLDMLSISMTTGIGLRTAFMTLLAKSDPLLQELWQPVTNEGEGGLVERLQSVVLHAEHSPTQRIANALIVSSERGTPIVEVLQSLAQEIRSESRRQLLEIAAKKDVQMMLPVVFGILPSITAIALFPAVGSLAALS